MQYVNVGVTLQIAPRVSDDGFVTSHVFAVVSSVTGTSQGYPTISQREASTSATVRDGDTFVIGGLTQESDLTTTTRSRAWAMCRCWVNCSNPKTATTPKQTCISS